MKNDPRSCERNLCNCVIGFEPVIWQYRCDALTNSAMKPLMLGVGQLCVHMFHWKKMHSI